MRKLQGPLTILGVLMVIGIIGSVREIRNRPQLLPDGTEEMALIPPPPPPREVRDKDIWGDIKTIPTPEFPDTLLVGVRYNVFRMFSFEELGIPDSANTSLFILWGPCGDCRITPIPGTQLVLTPSPDNSEMLTREQCVEDGVLYERFLWLIPAPPEEDISPAAFQQGDSRFM